MNKGSAGPGFIFPLDLFFSSTTIQRYCFSYCTSLTNVELPFSLLSIGDCAFSSLYANQEKVPMKQVEVPKNCEIGEHAFEDDCKVILK